MWRSNPYALESMQIGRLSLPAGPICTVMTKGSELSDAGFVFASLCIEFSFAHRVLAIVASFQVRQNGPICGAYMRGHDPAVSLQQQLCVHGLSSILAV